jgi:hypothetical protein
VAIGAEGTSASPQAWYGARAGLGPPNMTKGSDMARQLTFIDVDENRLELWLKPDRIQLVVIDSRPELEAGELRRFASVVFAEYVARDLADRLAAARSRLLEACDRASGGELGAALAGALGAIDDLAAAVAIPEPLPVPVEVDPEALEDDEPAPLRHHAPGAPGASGEPPRPEPIVLSFPAEPRRYPTVGDTLRASRKRPRRGDRAEEASELRWGGVAIATR